MIDLIIALVVLVVGAAAALLIRRRPELFWPLFMGLAIAGAGLMINGYAVVDEYLAASVVAGGLLAARQGLVPLRRQEKMTPHPHTKFSVGGHWWVFLLTLVYLILESVRGAIFLGDVIVLRWVGFYLLFGALGWLAWRWQLPLPSRSHAAKIVGVASSIYFGSYLLLGLVNECIRGVARWGLQGTIWAGSSYAIFPLLFAFPVAFFLLKADDKRTRRLGWITLITSFLAVGYYESRIGWLAIFEMSLFVPFVLGFRRALVVLGGILAISVFSFWSTYWLIHDYWLNQEGLRTPYCHALLTGKRTSAHAFARLFETERYKQQVGFFVEGITATMVSPVTSRISDEDRRLHLEAGRRTIIEKPARLLFGGGTNSHRLLIRSHLEELFREKLPDERISPVVRTTGLVALTVDFGLVGLGLLAANLLLAMKALIAGRSWFEWREVSILLFALLLIPFWLTASNIQDMIVYFWLFMPQNLFTFLRSSAQHAYEAT